MRLVHSLTWWITPAFCFGLAANMVASTTPLRPWSFAELASAGMLITAGVFFTVRAAKED